MEDTKDSHAVRMINAVFAVKGVIFAVNVRFRDPLAAVALRDRVAESACASFGALEERPWLPEIRQAS